MPLEIRKTKDLQKLICYVRFLPTIQTKINMWSNNVLKRIKGTKPEDEFTKKAEDWLVEIFERHDDLPFINDIIKHNNSKDKENVLISFLLSLLGAKFELQEQTSIIGDNHFMESIFNVVKRLDKYNKKTMLSSLYSKQALKKFDKIKGYGIEYENTSVLKTTINKGFTFIDNVPIIGDDLFILPKFGIFLEDAECFVLCQNKSKEKETSQIATPMEFNNTMHALKYAKGNVLCLGLGLGIFPYEAASKPCIKSITIVEPNPIVIQIYKEYFASTLKGNARRKINYINMDIDSFLNRKREMAKGNFDFIYNDEKRLSGDLMKLQNVIPVARKMVKNAKPEATFMIFMENFTLGYYFRPILCSVFNEMVKEMGYLDDYDENFSDRINVTREDLNKIIEEGKNDGIYINHISKKEIEKLEAFLRKEINNISIKNVGDMVDFLGYENMNILFWKYVKESV